MTELLDRDDEMTTVSGDYRWTPTSDLFADATPVTRPAVHASSYDLLSTLFRHRMYFRHSSVHSTTVRTSLPPYLVSLSDDAHLVADHPVTLALFGMQAVDDDAVEADELGPADPVEHPGTIALRDLQEWLGLGLDAIVGMVGLAPSTRAYWRSNPTAPVRPTKTGKLLRLRSAVGLLVGEIGIEEARVVLRTEGWLDEPFDDARLARFEVRVRRALMSEDLEPPAYLRAGGMSREQLLARALGDRAEGEAEEAQREAESAATSYVRGDDAPEEE